MKYSQKMQSIASSVIKFLQSAGLQNADIAAIGFFIMEELESDLIKDVATVTTLSNLNKELNKYV